MTSIKDIASKNRKEWQTDFWRQFLHEVSDVKSRKLIDAIFSSYEKQLIVNRLAAIILIRKGVSTKEIERSLWLSRSTISAIKRNLINKSANYGSPRFFKGKNAKKSWTNLTLKKAAGLLEGIDLLEILRNPPRPSSLGVAKNSKV